MSRLARFNARSDRGIAMTEILVTITIFGISMAMMITSSARSSSIIRRAEFSSEAAGVLAWHAAEVAATGTEENCPDPNEPIYRIGPDVLETPGGFQTLCLLPGGTPYSSAAPCADKPPGNCWQSWPLPPCAHVFNNNDCRDGTGPWDDGCSGQQCLHRKSVLIRVSWSISGCDPTTTECRTRSLPDRRVWLGGAQEVT